MEISGEIMYDWAKDLFPITRSITGPGVRETLSFISSIIPDLKICHVPSGTKAFDWEVPDEWIIHDAYVADENNNRVIDFRKNNLHLIGYSEPVDLWLDRDELDKYLYSLPDRPDAIPYVTSYYKRRWGFCLPHNLRTNLPPGRYHAYINSEIKPGNLDYGEIILKGKETKEILLSTYICHPSMANNELSGPVVTTALVKWLQDLVDRRFTYRICFIPETIGAIVYLSRNVNEMKKNTIAGFVLTCVGDNKIYSLMPSRKGGTLADKVAKLVLDSEVDEYAKYTFLNRGSDERQYCSPMVDLPVVSVMRSKYGTYPEYHTSFDNMDFISPEGLFGGYTVNKKCIIALEKNFRYKATIMGEPKMDKRGLRSNLSTSVPLDKKNRDTMNFFMYCDGKTDLLEIAEITGIGVLQCIEIAEALLGMNLIEITE